MKKIRKQAVQRSGAGTFRRLLACLCIFACVLSVTVAVQALEDTVPAEEQELSESLNRPEKRLVQPSSEPLYVMTSDIQELQVTKPLPVYVINDSIYMRPYDVGYILDFQVEYNTEWNALSILTDQHSGDTQVSTEGASGTVWAEPVRQSLYVDGKAVEGLSMYTIDGSCYVRLRDLAKAVNFGCCYSSRLNATVISAAFYYSPNDVMTEGGDRRITYTGGEIIMDPTVGRDAKENMGEFTVRLLTQELTMLQNSEARVYASVVWSGTYNTKWTSSDPAVVDVDEKGNLISGKSGEADVIFSVTANSQTVTKVCHVTVAASQSEIPSGAVTPTLEPNANTMKSILLDLINEARQTMSSETPLPVLKSDSALEAAAQTRAAELVKLYSHQRPDGSSFSTVIDDPFITGAEEMITTGLFTPEDVISVWKVNSQATLLNNSMTLAGIGYYADWDNYKVCWTCVFARQTDDEFTK